MKVSIATFFLLSPLPFAHGYEFASAVDVNVCGRELDGGYGWGRVEFITSSAACLSETKMHLLCLDRWDHTRYREDLHDCKGKESCVPHAQFVSPTPDAGCLVLHSPGGTKGSGDMDNHACSSGISIGNDDIFILSAVSADQLKYDTGIRTCIISRHGSTAPADVIYSKSPCPHKSTLLKLAKHTTYQACVTTAVALAKVSVGFTWHIRSPGRTVRRGPEQPGGLGQQAKPLSEMFTIVSNTTANEAIRIVIGD
ncbi:hypothetical protein EG327_001740 [Venturia inaequalis]|uniref:Uncharacterized protein n=1 Tax=Venturia inaequalis TaxID=5025 RepID=A0A8H3VP93_VENIN|nr:hypothetical protein EG327_001740 [Venturia inaequalis]